jgi:hypothetical protein
VADHTINRAAWQTALTFAIPVRERGAEAVVLTGEHVCGVASGDAPIELIALGDGPPERMARFNDFLVSLAWQTAEDVHTSFLDPDRALQSVPLWRDAVFLLDPDGVAAWLQREAHAWDWKWLDRTPEQHAADRLVRAAGDLHRMIANIERGALAKAAVQRARLALDLPRTMALAQRLQSVREDELIETAGAHMGPRWQAAQAAAIGFDGSASPEGCRAVLDLYALAAEQLSGHLAGWQSDVVEQVVEAAAAVLGGQPPGLEPAAHG